MNDETMDEQASDPAEVTRLAAYAGERDAERAADKGLPGLLEWVFTGTVK